MSLNLDFQHRESVLLIEERHALDQAGQILSGRSRERWRFGLQSKLILAAPSPLRQRLSAGPRLSSAAARPTERRVAKLQGIEVHLGCCDWGQPRSVRDTR